MYKRRRSQGVFHSFRAIPKEKSFRTCLQTSAEMKFIFCYFVLFVIVHNVYCVRAGCCYSKPYIFERNSTKGLSCKHFNAVVPLFSQLPNDCLIEACGDGKAVVGTFCGVGKCNIFGCNCDFGCIPGNARENLQQIHGGRVIRVHYNKFSTNDDK